MIKGPGGITRPFSFTLSGAAMARVPKESTQGDATDTLPATEQTYVSPDLEFETFLSDYDVSQGGEIRVYRQGPGGFKDLEYMEKYPIAEFEPSMLQRAPFYGGLFRIHVRSKDGFLKNFPFKCTAKEKEISPNAQPASDPAATLAPILGAMLEGFKALSAQIAQQAAPAGGGLKEAVEVLVQLRSLEPKREPAPDQFAMFERFVTLQKQLTPERDPVGPDGEVSDGAIMIEAMRTFGHPLGELVKHALNKNGAQAAPPLHGDTPKLAAPALAVVPNPAQSEQPEQPEPEGDDMNLRLAMMKPLFLAMARNNVEVSPYVDMALDAFTDEQIARYLTGPAWKSELLALMPEASEVMPWFERLREGILAALTEDADPGNVDEGEPDKAA